MKEWIPIRSNPYVWGKWIDIIETSGKQRLFTQLVRGASRPMSDGVSAEVCFWVPGEGEQWDMLNLSDIAFWRPCEDPYLNANRP